MVSYGQKWCGTAQAGVDATVSYYDGEWVYRKIKQYDQQYRVTGNPTQWDRCIQQAHDVYAHWVATAGDSQIPGHWVFTRGLAAGGDFATINRLVTHAAAFRHLWAGANAPFDLGAMREVSYALDANRLDSKAGDDRRHQIEQCVDYLLAHIERVVNDEEGAPILQSFMGGLAARALIEYYDDGHQNDTRVPLAVKTFCDWMWLNLWNTWAVANAFAYQLGPFRFGVQQSGADPYNLTVWTLNLLLAPAYAWLYDMGAGPLYQQEADIIWAAGLRDDDPLSWSGKIFNQNYSWSWAFVDDRTQAPPPPRGKL
jgi:hypothetical protein